VLDGCHQLNNALMWKVSKINDSGNDDYDNNDNGVGVKIEHNMNALYLSFYK